MSRPRVTISWTETALKALQTLPKQVRRGLWEKVGGLRNCADPAAAMKPLVGPLQGCFRVPYGRYRAICDIQEEKDAAGETRMHIRVRAVLAGIRKEGDKRDVYKFALRLLKLGILESDRGDDLEQTQPSAPP